MIYQAVVLCGLVHFSILTSVSGLVPRVLYESDRILVIDKPPGISHHNDDQTGELGIVSQLRDYYETQSPPSDDDNNNNHHKPFRLHGVHRLDRVTSGILIFAKDSTMAGTLSKAFRDRTAIKYYIGISHRKPKKKKQGWVKGDMVRGRRKSWYLTTNTKDDQGNDPSSSLLSSESNYAMTRFFTAGLGELGKHSLVDASSAKDEAEDLLPRTCVLFRPHTGKTHQLRVAAKSVGLPLLGDPIYSADASSTTSPRTFLHAAAIHLPLGGGGGGDDDSDRNNHESVTIWCPPPFAPLLWEGDSQDCFDQIMRKLMKKHCESPEILSALN